MTLLRENPDRAELQKQIDEYLARGGTITVHGPTGPREYVSLREASKRRADAVLGSREWLGDNNKAVDRQVYSKKENQQ